MPRFRSWRVVALLTLALLVATATVPTALFAREPAPPGPAAWIPPSGPVVVTGGYLSDREPDGRWQPRRRQLPDHLREIQDLVKDRPQRRPAVPVPDPPPGGAGNDGEEANRDDTKARTGSIWSWGTARPLGTVGGLGILTPAPQLSSLQVGVDSGTRATEAPADPSDPVADAYDGLLQRFELFRSW